MAHVGIERLGAGDREEDRPHHRQRPEAVFGEKAQGAPRVEGPEDLEPVPGVQQSQGGDHQEPDQRHRPEQDRDPGGSAALHPEKRDDDRDRDRQDVGVEMRRDQLEPLDRREHRDRRRDGRVAIEERGTRHAEHEEHAGAAPGRPLRERKQRQRSALAAVVGAHDEHDVLQRHDHDQGPDQQRDDADDLALGETVAPRGPQTLAQRIKRAGADVAIDDADRSQHQLPESGRVRSASLGRVGGAHGLPLCQDAKRPRVLRLAFRAGKSRLLRCDTRTLGTARQATPVTTNAAPEPLRHLQPDYDTTVKQQILRTRRSPPCAPNALTRRSSYPLAALTSQS